ncbi:MAG: hypothetical protein JWM44_3668 [Bacilli bacterium]|jgi:ribose transport system permease protein|nr:hypothetical protein [Bacilli bacterium]
MLIIIFFIILGSFIPNFLNPDNLLNVIRQCSIIAICAVGATLVIIIRGIDLSTSGIISLCAMLNGMLMLQDVNIALSICISLLVGLLIGLSSGFLIIKFGIPAFIATLVLGQLGTGIALIVNDGSSIGGFPNSYVQIGNGLILGIPISDFILIIFLLSGLYLLNYTPFGNHVYALGNNETVVKNEGIRIGRLKLLVFAFSGFCSAAAGILLSAQLDTAHPTQGEPFLLDAIAACIIGGVNLMGGEGKVGQSIIGALIIGCLRNALNLLGIHPFIQNIFVGSIIILIVALSIYNREKKSRMVAL